MKLTGKCKIDFEKWYLKGEQPMLGKFKISTYKFEQLPQSMRYGVLVDYFDSVGIEINIFSATYEWVDDGVWHWNIKDGDSEELLKYEEGLKSREEARDKAIERADEIRNEQL